MPKKQRKKSHSLSKKRTISFYASRYLLFFSIILFFFAVTTVYLHTSQPNIFCANSHSCKSDLAVHIDNNLIGTVNGKKIAPPKIDEFAQLVSQPVLGTTVKKGEKHIYIDLSKQTLYAYQGTVLFLKTLVSTGKWNPTPVGNFHVWEKLIATRMAGGEGADAYDLPNVPYVMYFYNDFGLHGAYWHNNFGHEMSHGCVNMRIVDAQKLYSWADGPNGNTPGTAVSVCDKITNVNQCIQNNPID